MNNKTPFKRNTAITKSITLLFCNYNLQYSSISAFYKYLISAIQSSTWDGSDGGGCCSCSSW